MNIGIIGMGRWGKKLLNVFTRISDVKMVCHKNDFNTSSWVEKHYPNIPTSLSYSDILENNLIDAVVIATPVNTHYKITKDALMAKKHVFVEKPLAYSKDEAAELIELNRNKTLFVGHTFLHNQCYRKLKEISLKQKPLTIDFVWNKMGTFNEDIVNNLMSHDIAIIGGLVGFDINNIIINRLEGNLSDVDFIDLTLSVSKYTKCNIKIDRANPIKQKIIRIDYGSGNLYYWIDNEIFSLDKQRNEFKSFYKNQQDTLELECINFIDCIKNKIQPSTDGFFGMEVVNTLDYIKHKCLSKIESSNKK